MALVTKQLQLARKPSILLEEDQGKNDSLLPHVKGNAEYDKFIDCLRVFSMLHSDKEFIFSIFLDGLRDL